ncbi:MAG TPA: hypothetical protein VGJ50_25680 [Streptosporangiaceae bacterium]
MITATSPRLARGISATMETKKLFTRPVNADPAWALAAGIARSPNTVSGRSDTVSGRSDTATNSRPIRTPAAAAAAAKYPVNSSEINERPPPP